MQRAHLIPRLRPTIMTTEPFLHVILATPLRSSGTYRACPNQEEEI
jgi:hypothetical protein